MQNLRWKIAQAAELRWWKRYLGSRPVADYAAWKSAYWQNLLERLQVEVQHGERILDAGCGPAGIFTVLPQAEVTAVDPLIDRYAVSLDHFQPGDYPHVRFVNASLEAFEAPHLFDHIFCLNAINHVADLEKSLDKLVSFLKPDGQLILSVDAHNSGILKKLFRTLPGDILHPHQYDLAEYQKMLTRRQLQLDQTVLYRTERIFNYYILTARPVPVLQS